MSRQEKIANELKTLAHTADQALSSLGVDSAQPLTAEGKRMEKAAADKMGKILDAIRLQEDRE